MPLSHMQIKDTELSCQIHKKEKKKKKNRPNFSINTEKWHLCLITLFLQLHKN